MKRIMIAIAALTGIPTLSAAHDFTVGELEINHPYVAASIGPAKTGAGYVVITNSGETADELIAVEADFPKVSVHQTEETDGIAKMTARPRLEIPAGETVTMEPGGLHIMFMGLEAPFKPGTPIPATLIFDKAGAVEIEFVVEERDAMGGDMTHDGQ